MPALPRLKLRTGANLRVLKIIEALAIGTCVQCTARAF
jgi:hypothetical protein